MAEAVRRRSTVVVESRERWLADYANPPGGDFQAFLAVPLVFEGRARGCMGLGLPLPGAPDEQDVGLLNAIARQGAQAVERARLFDERASIARTLQAGLLPRELPLTPGIELAVRYVPVGGGSAVGGDFYDVLELYEGTWLAAVGDVCGKGAQAAVHSGLLRTTIAGMALHAASPVEILELANRALMRQGQSWPYATVVATTFQVTPSGLHVDVASAGHPPALVRRTDATLEEVDAEGLMIGVQEELTLRASELSLRAGDALVLYTDGMVDARREEERFGEQRLAEAVAAAPADSAEALAEHVASAVARFETGAPRDDRALLVVRSP
jgi:serine phosphatase RsbU (regulator of sigma subunit)